MKFKLNKNSQLVYYLLIICAICLVIASLAGADITINLLNGQANKLVSLKANEQALATEQTNLIVAKKEVSKYASLEKIAEAIVPQHKDQAQAVRQIVNFAQESGITLNSITFPDSSLGITSSSQLSLSQLTPVKGIPRVYTLPIQVAVTDASNAVSYASFYNFLTKLEQNRLTSEITGLNIQPLANVNSQPVATSSNLITFSLTINEYIKPL